jgi:hypothetical protein
VFGLTNQSIIQNEVVHHRFIHQIWWDDRILYVSNELTMRNEAVMMDQLITFHK